MYTYISNRAKADMASLDAYIEDSRGWSKMVAQKFVSARFEFEAGAYGEQDRIHFQDADLNTFQAAVTFEPSELFHSEQPVRTSANSRAAQLGVI